MNKQFSHTDKWLRKIGWVMLARAAIDVANVFLNTAKGTSEAVKAFGCGLMMIQRSVV